MKLGLRKDRRGFTLIELMVVIAIMAVLAGIVTGGVTGSRSAGEDSRAQSDASTTEQGAKKFNSEDLSQIWPEVNTTGTVNAGADATSTIDDYYEVTVEGSGATAHKVVVPARLVGTTAGKINLNTDATFAADEYSLVKWDATAQVRVELTGLTTTATFVDDFTPRKSNSSVLNRDLDTGTGAGDIKVINVNEYLWVMKKVSTFDPAWNTVDTRRVEIWKLADDGKSYGKLYPEGS